MKKGGKSSIKFREVMTAITAVSGWSKTETYLGSGERDSWLLKMTVAFRNAEYVRHQERERKTGSNKL